MTEEPKEFRSFFMEEIGIRKFHKFRNTELEGVAAISSTIYRCPLEKFVTNNPYSKVANFLDMLHNLKQTGDKKPKVRRKLLSSSNTTESAISQDCDKLIEV